MTLEHDFDLMSHEIEEYVFEDVRCEMEVNCATSGIMLFVEDDVVFKVYKVIIITSYYKVIFDFYISRQEWKNALGSTLQIFIQHCTQPVWRCSLHVETAEFCLRKMLFK